MQLNPYLTFNGNCAAALKFYEQHLGAKIEMKMTFGESPAADQAPAGWRDKVMHARLAIGESILMASDAPPDRYNEPKGFSVSLSVKTPAEAERIFAGLAGGGTVQMPIQQTFWAARFGTLVDKFGIPWMVNCEQSA
jgi:PhnB protein